MVSVPYLIHETSTDVLFIWHRDRNPQRNLSRCDVSCTWQNILQFSKQLQKLFKRGKKRPPGKCTTQKILVQKKTRRFGWFPQCVSDFLKENAWNKNKIHWSVGPSLRSQETSGASQSSWGPCKRLGLNSRIEPKTCKNYNHYASEKKIKVHGIVPVQSRVNLSIPGALRVSDKKNVPAIVASVKTIFRSLVFKKRMEFHNNQSGATCVFHVVLENSLFILCIHSNKQLAELFWMRKAHKTQDSTRWHN